MGIVRSQPAARTDEHGAPQFLLVGRPLADIGADHTRVVYPIHIGSDGSPARLLDAIQFRISRPLPAADSIGIEPGIAACLMPALASRRNLAANAPVCPVFTAGIGHYQEVYSTWRRDYRKAEFLFEPGAGPGKGSAESAPRGEAMLFSGGIDSLHTLARLQSRLSALVFISGFDVAPDHGRHSALAIDNARTLAEELGLEFIEVETDARQFGDRHVEWQHYGGSILGAVALLLRPLFHTVHVAPDYDWTDLRNESVHPVLHECWKTSGFSLRCDSLATNRAGKCAVLAGRPDLLRRLRVCWEMPPGHLNCGVCEKCVRSLAGLDIHGAVLPPGVFAAAPDPARLHSLELRPKWVPFYRQLLDAAVLNGRQDWAGPLKACLDRAGWRAVADAIRESKTELPDSAAWEKHSAHLKGKLLSHWLENDDAWVGSRLHRHRARWRALLGPALASGGRWRHLRRVARLRLRRAWRSWLEKRLARLSR